MSGAGVPSARGSLAPAAAAPPSRAGGAAPLALTPSLLGGAVLAMAVLGCSQRAALDRQLDEVALRVREVEARGARGCAPRELAVAHSHLEFARLERARGFPGRAREHLEVADESLRAASVLSPASGCAER